MGLFRASLAFSRIDRTKRKEFDIWHPADCIGDVGAVSGLVMVAVLKAACEKGYTKGDHILAHSLLPEMVFLLLQVYIVRTCIMANHGANFLTFLSSSFQH